MPRRPPRTSAVEMAHTFVHVFIAESPSDNQILPKNGRAMRTCTLGSARMRAGLPGRVRRDG